MQQQELAAAQGAHPQRNYEEMANLEEAFRYQEMELQKEREAGQQMRMQLMKLSDSNSKFKEKQDNNKKKLKKYNELSTQIMRQGSLMDKKSKEIGSLRMQVNQL